MKKFLMPTRRLSLLRWPTLAITCLLLVGCQLWPFKQLADEPPPVAEEAAVEEEPGEAAASIEEAMTLLQNGEEAQAEAMLEKIAQERPGNATTRLLLAQIRRPPEELLGDSYAEVEVRAGESLSAIAGRTINNELLFYSLAKLNGIEVPRLVQPGQRLKVPLIAPEAAIEPDAEPDTAPAEQARPGSRDPDQLELTARQLIDRERYSQAYALLLSTARAGRLDESGQALLAEAAVALSQVAEREGDPELAAKHLRQALPWLDDVEDHEAFARQRRHLDAGRRLVEAERLLARGEQAAAFDALMAARELDEELARAHGQKLARLEAALGEYYHDLAVSAWRDQNVDQAVELWDRVVRINPGFEPAIRYLERARRAQRQLKNLDEG